MMQRWGRMQYARTALHHRSHWLSVITQRVAWRGEAPSKNRSFRAVWAAKPPKRREKRDSAGACGPHTPSRHTPLSNYSLCRFFFRPAERKKNLTREGKYHAAIRPEHVEGQATIAFALVLKCQANET